MRKNVFLILLVTAVFLAVGTASQNAKAADDPVEAIRNAKTPVHLHSLAPGDDLVDAWADVANSQWESMYPPATYGHTWICSTGQDKPLVGWLSHSDKLKIEHSVTHNWIWVFVDTVTITLVVDDGAGYVAYLEFRNPPDPDNLVELITEPAMPVWNPLHEIWPTYCSEYTITGFTDNSAPANGIIDTGDQIQTNGDTWWTVVDVAVDIEVFSIPDPQVPTMTQWGIIVLVALIIASAIFIMVRRRKATVAA